MSATSDADRQLAADYDLIYADWDRAVAVVQGFLNGHLPLNTGTLLDAHATNGLAADAAARLGWTVTAADVSPAMIERVHARLPDIEVRQARPLKLHEDIPRQFDAVMSVGNTLATLQNAEVREAVQQMRMCIRPGGACMIAIRDFAERQKSAVWRDDPLARVAARFRYQDTGEIVYTLDIDDADGSRSHDQILHPISELFLQGVLDDTGFTVRRMTRTAGRLVVAATVS